MLGTLRGTPRGHCHAKLLDAVRALLGTVQALPGHASAEVTQQLNLPVMLVDEPVTPAYKASDLIPSYLLRKAVNRGL